MFNPEAAASDMTPEWVANALAKAPCAKNETTGNTLTCIARLSFPHLYEPQEQESDNGGKPRLLYNGVFLFPAGADLTVMKEEAARVAREKWGDQVGNYTLHSPFKDQGEKAARYPGYVAGSICVAANSQRKPYIVDQNSVPIAEEDKMYPGCWVRLVTNPFTFETRNKQGAVLKRGVSFGLNGVVRIADDRKFGGGSANPGADLQGIAAIGDLGPAVNPSSLFSSLF